MRYLPMIARTNDPVVRRFIDTGKGKKAASVKRVWSVYDTTTDEWMPQPSVHAGWQTRAGCQRTCDKLNK